MKMVQHRAPFRVGCSRDEALLCWRSDDPFAALVAFAGGVEWHFSIDLILSALSQVGVTFGEGDVTCLVSGESFELCLRPPSATQVTLAFPLWTITDFVGLFRPYLIPAQVDAQDAMSLEADQLLRM